MANIGTTTAFYKVETSLTRANTEVSKSMERLATGRQNANAGDRSSYVAMSDTFRMDFVGTKAGLKGGSVVMGYLETGMRVLDAASALLSRLQELAVLGANNTNTTADHEAINAEAEALGDGSVTGMGTGGHFNEMAFSIEKHTVTAVTRALKAEYTMELAQDLKAIHGLDAETELANILSSEILAEINREVVRNIYVSAVKGAQTNTTNAGIFDLDTDSNGRWSVEKFKGLMFAIERDANAIGQQTRRGKGNMILCSADVASALQMAGVLDYTPALNNNLNVDDTSTTFAGVMNGRYKVYVDPYAANVAASQYYVVGYKGTSPYDAGMFYCPYVPLQMVRAVGENSFQPKIGFKTRYGIAANPFHTGTVAAGADGAISISSATNKYYRKVKVSNLM